jgi:hypothetical protein
VQTQRPVWIATILAALLSVPATYAVLRADEVLLKSDVWFEEGSTNLLGDAVRDHAGGRRAGREHRRERDIALGYATE